MDGDRVAAPTLDDDRPSEERADGCRQHVETATQQGQPGELVLELGRPPIELGPPIDEKADDAPLETGRLGPSQAQDGQAGGRRRPGEGVERPGPAVALEEQDCRDTRPGQCDRELVHLARGLGDHLERRPGDDREIARVERVEGGDPGLEDPDPGDLALRPTRLESLGADRSRGREDRPVDVVEARHARRQPGRRTPTRSSSSRPNSRSTST